jgi:hypothetical protein
VTLPSFSVDDKESDDGGSESDINCFSIISLEGPGHPEDSGPTGFEAVEWMELGFGSSSEGLGLGFGQIAEGTLDDEECLDVDDVDPANRPKPPMLSPSISAVATKETVDVGVHNTPPSLRQLSHRPWLFSLTSTSLASAGRGGASSLTSNSPRAPRELPASSPPP